MTNCPKCDWPVVTQDETLHKRLAAAQLLIVQLRRREALLRTQFAFYVQYGQMPETGEFPSIAQTLTPTS